MGFERQLAEKHRLYWVVAGGESGPGARPCQLEWLRSLRDQSAAAGVPYFLKQFGANVIGRWLPEPLPDLRDGDGQWLLHDSHGGDPDEWPADLRVRQWPVLR